MAQVEYCGCGQMELDYKIIKYITGQINGIHWDQFVYVPSQWQDDFTM